MLPTITQFFPQDIDTMYDLFAGGCDVCTNVVANKTHANDINHFVIGIYKAFQQMDIDSLLQAIDLTIERTIATDFCNYVNTTTKHPLRKEIPLSFMLWFAIPSITSFVLTIVTTSIIHLGATVVVSMLPCAKISSPFMRK